MRFGIWLVLACVQSGCPSSEPPNPTGGRVETGRNRIGFDDAAFAALPVVEGQKQLMAGSVGGIEARVVVREDLRDPITAKAGCLDLNEAHDRGITSVYLWGKNAWFSKGTGK